MNRWFRWGVCSLLLLGILAPQPSLAQRPGRNRAQDAAQDKKQQEQEKAQRLADRALNARITNLSSQLTDVFRNGTLTGDQQRQQLQQLMDTFVQKMQLPYNYKNERLAARVVQQLLGQLRSLGNLRSTAAHDEAVAHLLRQLPAVVAKKDAPLVVRYNAVLLIGLLNQREARDTQPPLPLEAALPVLLDIVSDTQKYPLPIRIGALAGLVRHARYGQVSDPQLAARLQRALLQVLEKAWPELDSSPEVKTWVRTRAAQALGYLRAPGTPGGNGYPVLEKLYQVAANPEEDLSLRIAALEALSRLDLSQVQGFNPYLPALVAVDLIHRSISREVPLDLMYRQVQADVARMLLAFWGADGQGGLAAQVQEQKQRESLAEAIKALQRVRDVLSRRVPTDRRDPEREKELQQEFFEKLKADLESEAEWLKTWLEKNPRQGKLLQGS